MSTRSYHGCWTCKRRRRRCDNARPTCKNCMDRGIECEGYEVRLRWGCGIASRGQFTGADKPLRESVPPRPRGRRRDWSRERKRGAGQGLNPSSSEILGSEDATQSRMTAVSDPGALPESIRSDRDELLFTEFLTTGINVLHSTTVSENLLQPRLPALCKESSALYDICLTFQLSLTSTQTTQFLEYFDRSLREFRTELAQSTRLSDGTFTAGLLLCSIGLVHGMSWTMHIEGMYNILRSTDFAPLPEWNTLRPFRIHLLEVLGVMDIPCLTVGRQIGSFGIWRRICQSLRPRVGVEPVTGLPRSFMDLLAGIGIDTSEQSFWDWPAEPGNFLQCYLWEAYRLAGILYLRQIERKTPTSSGPQTLPTWRQQNSCPIDSNMLVARVLANVDALRLGCAERPDEDSFIQNSSLFPLVIVGKEVHIMRQNSQWQEVIRRCTLELHRDGIIFEILEEMWQDGQKTPDIDERARARGVEVGIL